MGPYMQSFTCICLRPLKKNNKKPRLQINGETKPLQCPSHGWSVASASTAWLHSGWRLCRMTLRSLGLRFSFCCWKEDWTQKTRLRRLITMDNTSLIGLHAGRNWWLWWAWGGPSLGPGTADPWNDLHQLWVIIWLTLNNYVMIKHIHHMWLNMNCD